MNTSRTRIAALSVVAALALPAVASAHVTVQPAEAPAGAYVVENVRVPNEKYDSGTTKVVVQFPAGFKTIKAAYVQPAGAEEPSDVPF